MHIAEYIKSLLLKYDDFSTVNVSVYNYKAKRKVDGFRYRTIPRIYKVKNKNAYNLEFNCPIFNDIINNNITIIKGGEKIIKESLFNTNNLLPLVLGFLEGDGHQKSTLAKSCLILS